MKKTIVKLKQKLVKTFTRLLVQGASVDISGNENLPSKNSDICRQAAAEGIVLLANDGTLPLSSGSRIALFGRCNYDYFFVGYGSGGEVHSPYRVSFYDALRSSGRTINPALNEFYSRWRDKNPTDEGVWGFWPYSYDEAVVPESVLSAPAAQSDVAIVTIGRAAGEDRENKPKKGSYYLTDKERKLLKTVTERFSKTVLILDVGSIIDTSFLSEYRFSAVLLAFLGGSESGNALCDVVFGQVNPCGRLPDTVARSLSDYPSYDNFGNKKFNFYCEDIFVGYRYFETFARDKVLFPFGYGLSYTDFAITNTTFSYGDSSVTASFTVKNVGSFPGKEVVQIYVSQPDGKLGKADKQLVFYKKTNVLAPGESVEHACEIPYESFASYDDNGSSGNPFCYVLESGEYRFFIGKNVRDCDEFGAFFIEKTKILQRLEQVMPVKNPFYRMKAVSACGEKRISYEAAPHVAFDLRERILHGLPEEIPFTGDKGYVFSDVVCGKITLDDFVAQLTDEELARITVGDVKMNSPLGTEGNAGAFGGVSESLRKKGVPPIITTDGPAGIRLARYATLMPCGTCLASTWNDELVQRLTSAIAEEMKVLGSDALLAPGMNVHRNPLCGRNFEYFSEDPFLSGKIAAAYVRGIQSGGLSACPKHLACNNQETNRTHNDSRVSERALREIYLKGFEICVKESSPLLVMTSYNKINGVWSHYNYDLAETVLRKEWGFDGCVLTDWWMRRSASPEFENVTDNAYRVRSRVDVLMPGAITAVSGKIGDSIESSLAKGGITRAELQLAAKDVLNAALRLKR